MISTFNNNVDDKAKNNNVNIDVDENSLLLKIDTVDEVISLNLPVVLYISFISVRDLL